MNDMVIGNSPNVAAFGFPFRALTTVDINSQKVFTGQAFSWSKRFVCPSSADNGGIYDIVVDLTEVADEKNCVILPVAFTAFGAGPIFIDLYIDPVYTLGSDIPGSNRDHNSPNTPGSKMIIGVTTSNPGTKIPAAEFMVPSDGVPAVSSFGGQAKDDLILVANCGLKYMFRLMNQEANPADCVIALTLFEAEIDK